MFSRSLSIFLLITATSTLFFIPDSAFGDIPKIITYQGKVTDSGGIAVPDGNYQMRFRIMDAPTGTGVLWDSGTQPIAVNSGIFNVLFGESPQPSIDLDFAQNYWLLVTFEGINQTPRQHLASTGYAYMASGLVPGTEISGAVTSGNYAAIYGSNTATSGTNYGLYGRTSSTSGRGVYGFATASTGTNYGVHGRSNSSSGMGVYGYALASSGTTYGGRFESNSTSGRAVYGYASAATGSTYGIRGQVSSTSGKAISGFASASSGTNYGVHGATNSGSGYGVYYVGGIGGSSVMRNIVRTEQGPIELYAHQATENWFEDFGEGRLVNGRIHVELDPLFLETVTIDENNPMKVFIQLRDDCKGIYVKTRTSGFDVIELQGGTSNSTFAYRVVAKRKGFEEMRLDFCQAGLEDSYLYPELRQKELQELEEDLARHELP